MYSLKNSPGRKNLESKLFYDTGDFFDSYEGNFINYGEFIGKDKFDHSTGIYFCFKKDSNNSFIFSYFNRGDNSISLRDRTKLLPLSSYTFVEDRNNTFLYLVLPKKVGLEKLNKLYLFKKNQSQLTYIKPI